MRRDHAHTKVPDREFNSRMAASILPERIHPPGRRRTFNQAPRRNSGTMEKPSREGAVPAVDTYRTGATRTIPEETGDGATMTHTLDFQLLERPIRILVVGCGG